MAGNGERRPTTENGYSHPVGAKSFASLFQQPETNSNRPPVKKPKFFNGILEIEYDESEFEALIAPYKRCLVGKFSYGRPSMLELRKEFGKIGFKGRFDLGLINPRHVLIRFELDDDYQRCWLRPTWNIGGYQMRILKWRPCFKFEEDPPIVSVWVTLHELPIEFINEECIFSMAEAIGKPLQVDSPTLNITCPSLARVCLEADITKVFPEKIRIGRKGSKHEQLFTYEYIPEYCQKCKKIGHHEDACHQGKHQQSKKLAVKPPANTITQKESMLKEKVIATVEKTNKVGQNSGLTDHEKARIPVAEARTRKGLRTGCIVEDGAVHASDDDAEERAAAVQAADAAAPGTGVAGRGEEQAAAGGVAVAVRVGAAGVGMEQAAAGTAVVHAAAGPEVGAVLVAKRPAGELIAAAGPSDADAAIVAGNVEATAGMAAVGADVLPIKGGTGSFKVGHENGVADRSICDMTLAMVPFVHSEVTWSDEWGHEDIALVSPHNDIYKADM